MSASRQQRRRELREKRLQAEKKQTSGESKKKAFLAIGAIALVGVGVALVLIFAGGGEESTKSENEINQLLAGIPQQGTTLGKKGAPVTLVEFGDLQCPACKEFANSSAPKIIEGPVRSGKLLFEFRQWPILGADSTTAALAALAAAKQGRYWQFIEHFYAEQGAEGTGYVTDDFLLDIAEKAGVPDIEKWEKDRLDIKLEDELVANDEQAVDFNFTGTPSFAIKRGKGPLEPLEFSGDVKALLAEINK